MVKQRVYAQAGIPDYWVLDLDARRVVRHREPTPDGHRVIHELCEGDVLGASALDLPPLDLRELFAAAHR